MHAEERETATTPPEKLAHLSTGEQKMRPKGVPVRLIINV